MTISDFPILTEEIRLIVGGFHATSSNQKALVNKWSSLELPDYQAVLQLVGRMLRGNVPFRIEGRGVRVAAMEVILNSSLSMLFEYDSNQDEIKYKISIPVDFRNQISSYVLSLSPGAIAN